MSSFRWWIDVFFLMMMIVCVCDDNRCVCVTNNSFFFEQPILFIGYCLVKEFFFIFSFLTLFFSSDFYCHICSVIIIIKYKWMMMDLAWKYSSLMCICVCVSGVWFWFIKKSVYRTHFFSIEYNTKQYVESILILIYCLRFFFFFIAH